MFVQIAGGLGIRGIVHTDYRSYAGETSSAGIAATTKRLFMKPGSPHILTINGGSSSIKLACSRRVTRCNGSLRAELSGLDCQRRRFG